MSIPTRSRWPTLPRCARGDVGPWRPPGGCEHDECELIEREVEAWRTGLEDPTTRILTRYDLEPSVAEEVADGRRSARSPRLGSVPARPGG